MNYKTEYNHAYANRPYYLHVYEIIKWVTALRKSADYKLNENQS